MTRYGPVGLGLAQGDDGLARLAQAHVVGEDRPLAGEQEGDAAALVVVERRVGLRHAAGGFAEDLVGGRRGHRRRWGRTSGGLSLSHPAGAPCPRRAGCRAVTEPGLSGARDRRSGRYSAASRARAYKLGAACASLCVTAVCGPAPPS